MQMVVDALVGASTEDEAAPGGEAFDQSVGAEPYFRTAFDHFVE